MFRTHKYLVFQQELPKAKRIVNRDGTAYNEYFGELRQIAIVHAKDSLDAFTQAKKLGITHPVIENQKGYDSNGRPL
jgi:hypothetical protein